MRLDSIRETRCEKLTDGLFKAAPSAGVNKHVSWMQSAGGAVASAPNVPACFGLGIACKIFGSLGAQWFYQGESLGYRTLYFWIADQDLMITVQTNSQPPEGTDKLGEAVSSLYEIVKKRKAN